jgi:hypothetical protein
MRAPSNRSGIPATPVIVLVAVILFLGLSLGPRTFEFQAWPQPSRQGAIEAIVDRPAEPATEVPVARADVPKRKQSSLDVRGRNPRRRGEARAGRRDARRSAGSRRGSRPDRRPPSVPPVVVEDPPAPQPDAPEPAPEQPAQLAEGPSTDQVLRPEVEEFPPEQRPAPLRDLRSESRGHGGGSDHGDGSDHGAGDSSD